MYFLLFKSFLCLNIFFLFLTSISGLQEASDGSVCFNQCSGHGECIDYSCHCTLGYYGDDCSVTFHDQEQTLIPILSAGHANITKQNFTQVLSRHTNVLIGFSSYSCYKCIRAESIYQNISSFLQTKNILFVRGDVDQLKTYALEYGITELPALVFVHKLKPHVYHGVHSIPAIQRYIQKVTAKLPLQFLQTIEEVESFLQFQQEQDYALSTIKVIGMFSQHTDIEEDEYEDFLELAKELQYKEDIFFGIVTRKTITKHYQQIKLIDRTPSILLTSKEINQTKSINLNELYGEQGGLKEWLLKQSIPLVGKITPLNFGLYEKLNIPMLLMFLNLKDEHLSSDPSRIVGGRSGGLLNEILLDEFRLAAKEHQGRIVFGYLDGNQYQDQMKSLGLYGGIERLPSLAFNTRDGKQIAFPEELSINKETILQFCANYLSGKLNTKEDIQKMTQKSLQRSIPMDTRNKATRQAIKSIPQVVQGVSEQFGDGLKGDQAVQTVTLANFQEIVLNEDKDVVLLLHAKTCESCGHFNVYFKRMADRFHELNIPSLVIAQMDVSQETPPSHLNMMPSALPILLLAPANAKLPPWTFYSGVGKVQQMMKWVEKYVSIPFTLPNLPHLSEKDRIAYKEQVREREEALEKKRMEEQQLMDEESRIQEEIRQRNKKQQASSSSSNKKETIKQTQRNSIEEIEDIEDEEDEL